jgi:predicted alpha/beta hydrolase
VGAQLVDSGNWPIFDRIRLGALLHGLMPAATRMFGYLPGRFGLGEDLPQGVADEWAAWCRHPEYLISAHPAAIGRYASFDRPTLFYSFTDDGFAPRGAVTALLGKLSSARIEHRRVGPSDVGGPIGHFGFFRPRFRDSLWSEAVDFVRDAFAGRPRPVTGAALPFQIRMEDVLSDLQHHGG